MAKQYYKALIRDFPDLYILSAWVDDFYENIEKVREKGYISGRAYYGEADRRFYQIGGFIEAMNVFGKIDNERRRLLKEEFLQAIKDGVT